MPLWGKGNPLPAKMEGLHHMSYEIKENTKAMGLLSDRHINNVLFPNCFNKNKEYYQDSANAYRSSSKVPKGEGCFKWKF